MITAMNRTKTRRKWVFALCVIVVLLFAFTPVQAGGVGDLLTTIIGFIIACIAKMILFFFELVAGFFLRAMNIDIDLMASYSLLHGFTQFADGIELLGVTLASIVVVWQLFTILFGPWIGAKQTQSVGSIIGRALIFIPLTYFIQDLALIATKEIQKIYGAFLSAYDVMPDGGIHFNMLSSQVDFETLANTMGMATGSDLIPDALMGVMTVVIAVVIMCLVMWNFIKLLFETAQRFVAMLVYTYLSPLAAACGVGVNTINITKQTLSLFLSSGVLWILNVWSVGITLMILKSFGAACTGGADVLILWCVLAYGFVKIAQQLDDVFNAVGATNVRFSGSLLQDLLELGRVGEIGSRVSHGLSNFAENGLFGGRGSSSTNPTKPQDTKIPLSASGMQRSSASAGAGNGSGALSDMSARMPKPELKANITGQQARNAGQQVADKATAIVGNSVPGKIARGAAKTAENLKTRINAGVTEARVADDNRSMNHMHGALSQSTPEGRSAAMSELAKNNPSALSNRAVKDYVGQAMGLKENQQVAGLSVGPDGQLTASVATTNGNGGITMSKVSGINDMDFAKGTDGLYGKGVTVGGSETATFGLTELGSPNMASVGFKNGEGNEGVATVTKGDSIFDTSNPNNPTKMDTFGISDGNGNSIGTITAPTGTSAMQVAEAIGTASFGATENGMDVSSIQSQLNIDTSCGAIVTPGDSWEQLGSSQSAVISSGSGETATTATLNRQSVGEGESTWSISNADGESFSFAAPANATTRSVADGILNGETTQGDYAEGYSQAKEFSGLGSENATVSVGAGGGSDRQRLSNGTEWQNEFSFAAGDTAGSGVIEYQSSGPESQPTQSKAWFRPSESQGATNQTVYHYGNDSGDKGTFTVDTGVTAEQIAAAIVSEGGGNLQGMKEVQKQLGITNPYHDADMLLDMMSKAKRKKGMVTSVNAPVEPKEK